MSSWGAAVAAVAIVVTSGCSGSSVADPPAATTVAPTTAKAPESTARVTTTTKRPTPPPPYSFDNSVPAPKLVNSGKPRPEIVESQIAFVDWLNAHRPDSALIPKVAAENSSLFKRLQHNLSELRSGRTRLYETKTAPDEIAIVSTTPTAFTARIVQHLQYQRVVKESGRITSERPVTAPITYIALFSGGPEQWRLVAVDAQP